MNENKLQFILWKCKQDPELYKDLKDLDLFFEKHSKEYNDWRFSEEDVERLKEIIHDKGVKLVKANNLLKIFSKYNDISALRKILNENGLISFKDIELNVPYNIYNLIDISKDTIKDLISFKGSYKTAVGKGEDLFNLILKESCNLLNKGDVALNLNNILYLLEVKANGGSVGVLGCENVNIVSEYIDKMVFGKRDSQIINYFGKDYTLKYLLNKLNEHKKSIESLVTAIAEGVSVQMNYKIPQYVVYNLIDSLSNETYVENGEIISCNSYPLANYLGFLQLYCYLNRHNIDYLLTFNPKTMNFIINDKESLMNFKHIDYIKFGATGGDKGTGKANVTQEYSASINFNERKM